MILPVVQIPNTILTTKTKSVKKFDKKLRTLVSNMKETLLSAKDPEGVGLAAPQVGVAISLFIMREDHGESNKMLVCINPKILNQVNSKRKKQKKKTDPIEGCLSINNVWASIKRPSKVELQFYDVMGKKHTRVFTDFESAIVFHELDHLNGILFTQRAVEQNATLYEDDGDTLYEIEL